MPVSKGFADDLIPEQGGVSDSFADNVLLGKKKAAETEESEGIDVFSLIPNKTSDEVLKSIGVDPKSSTLAEDIRKASTPAAQSERIVVGAGAGFKNRMDGVIQRGLEVQQLFRQTGIPFVEEPKGFGFRSPELEKFTREGTQDRETFQASPTGQSTGAAVGETAAYVVPLMILPGAPRTILGATATGGGIGAASALTTFIPEGESLYEELKGQTTTGALAGMGIGTIGRLINAAKGGGMVKQHPEVRQLIDDIREAKAEGMNVEKLMLHQEVPENMIIGGLGRQATSTSKFGQHLIAEQEVSALRALKTMGKLHASKMNTGKVVLSEAQRAYIAQRAQLLNQAKQIKNITPESAGKALKAGIADDFIKKSRVKTTKLYNLADDAAATEAPQFNVAGAKIISGRIREGIGAEGAEGLINVADSPTGKLLGILDDIDDINTSQVNYEAIKQLRTRTGSLIEDWPWNADFNKGQAKQLYRALTDTLNAPVNAAPKYQQAIKKATSFARARFEVMDAPTIRAIVRSDDPFALYQKFGKPGTMTKEVRETLRVYAPDKLKTYRNMVQQDILTNKKGAVNALEEWAELHPESFSYAFPKNELSKLMETAKKMDELTFSNLGRMFSAQTKAKDAVRNLIDIKGSTKADMDNIIESFGGQGSKGHKALISGIYEDFLDNTLTRNEFGVQIIDSGKLSKMVDQYRRSGAWTILPKSDQVKLAGLDSYMKQVSRGMDPGVALERAQAIAQLKRPSQFLAGVHKLGVNEVMARVMANKGFKQFVAGKGAEPWKTPGYVAARTGVMIDALKEDAE